MALTFQRTYPPATPQPGLAFWLPFRDDQLLVEKYEQGIRLIKSDEAGMAALQPEAILYLGTLDGIPCLACEVSSEYPLPDDLITLGLRDLYGQLDDIAYGLAGYASQLLRWQRNNHFCPSCGSTTEIVSGTWGKSCPNCGHNSYPPVVPAILVLVHNGEHVLLATQPGWGKRYSIIAGFVEPGETLEECVHREVYEEVGLTVTDVTYVGSQPWPFPHQLMIGFTARYSGGEIRLDHQELADARWFRHDQLPSLPPPLSLSRQIIDGWVAALQRANR